MLKRTILSEKEINLLESLIASYGEIVTTEQIFSILKGKLTHQSIKNLINKLSKNGWLVRIKRGVYFVSGLETRNFISIPVVKIAQIIEKDSYVSFETALQYYGMFDQFLNTVISISKKSSLSRIIQNINYKYILVKDKIYFGYEEKRIDGYIVKIARPEKAILDMLSYQRDLNTIDLILEKIKEYKNDFNFDLLNKFSKQHSKTVQRILGFLLDKVNIDTNYLYESIKKSKSCSYMSKNSDKFNSRWRLYYDGYFE